jgi:hypothetical protein
MVHHRLGAHGARRIGVVFGAMLLFVLGATGSAEVTASGPVSAGSRVPWQGGEWYLHGANVPWVNWACDFGCGVGTDKKGVSDPVIAEQLDTAFRQARDGGVRVLRWWVFPGSEPWQITRDASGAPGGIDPAVYPDFDAALRLAEKFDLYYVFTLFSAPTHLPSAWLAEASQREKLAAALGTLFAHYHDNPRVLAWDVFNEPDWDIFNGQIAKEPVQATVRAVANAVHASSTAYVTVAAAMLDGLPHWVGQGLDFYTANWYDPMSSGNWCAFCTNYAEVRDRYQLDAPLVIGEFYGGPDINPLMRFTSWYTKGYAGAWAWSLFPDNTNDKLRIDLAAAGAFARQYADIGPRAPATP